MNETQVIFFGIMLLIVAGSFGMGSDYDED